MKKIKSFGLLILFFSFLACSQESQINEKEKIKNGWKEFTESNYSIQYPEDWELNSTGQMGTKFILFSKQSSPQDLFKENVNLLIQDLKGQKIDLDKYVEISEGQIKTMITNADLIESKRLNEKGNEFHRIIYSGDQGEYKLKFEQYYRIQNGKVYVITLTCELNQFDAYKVTGEKILNSFRLK